MKNKIIFLMALGLFLKSCSSYEKFKYLVEEFEHPAQIYRSDYTETWQAIQEVTKSYDITHKNSDTGVIKTQWIDNTNELNFTDHFGDNTNIKAGRFKLTIQSLKITRGTKEFTKVTIYKRQFVEYDSLQGWRETPTDGILEKTILYRIGQILKIDQILQKIEKKIEETKAEVN